MLNYHKHVAMIIIMLTLAPAGLLAEAAPSASDVRMIDVYYFRDGGTTGFDVEVNGARERFCLDGRMSHQAEPPQYHLFLNVTHPDDAGAIEVPLGGAQEKRILAIISTWIDASLTPAEQASLLEGTLPRTTPELTKLWWAMRVRDKLKARNSVPQRAR